MGTGTRMMKPHCTRDGFLYPCLSRLLSRPELFSSSLTWAMWAGSVVASLLSKPEVLKPWSEDPLGLLKTLSHTDPTWKVYVSYLHAWQQIFTINFNQSSIGQSTVQKQAWEASCLLLSQMLKQFVKMQNNTIFLIDFFGLKMVVVFHKNYVIFINM